MGAPMHIRGEPVLNGGPDVERDHTRVGILLLLRAGGGSYAAIRDRHLAIRITPAC